MGIFELQTFNSSSVFISARDSGLINVSRSQYQLLRNHQKYGS